MEYEAFEPDFEDEYYDELCSFEYAKMFNERSGGYEAYDSCNQGLVAYAVAG